MKLLYYSIIVILIFSASLYLKPIWADDTSGIEIKNIQTLPPAIIIGQTFKISATLVNNSTQPIFVDYGSCKAPFSVTFDNHVLVNETHPICNFSLLQQKLNPSENTTATSPSLDLVYRAINNGTVNATITFPYQIWNQTIQSNSNEIISEPFSFTIYGKTPVPTLSPSSGGVISEIDSPLKQFKSGIAAKDVKCKEGLKFIMKNENGQPACVTPHTFDELITRGWGIIPLGGLPTYDNTSISDTGIHPFSINVTNTNFTLNYNVSGNNKLLDANMDSHTESLVLSMYASSNGTLSISIPRALLDSKSPYSNQDTKFIILIDKQEVKYTETTSITARILTIPFELGAKKIEITAPMNI